MASTVPKQEVGDESAPAAAGGGGGLGALSQLINVQDPRLQAAGFFLFCGCSVITYGTALNRSANPDHVLAGFFMFTVGAALALLTLAGGGAGRAAAQAEEALRVFF